jgi:hypothetical protein
MPFLGDKAQRLQLVAAQIAKQSNGFKRGHQRALYQFQHVNGTFFVAVLCERRWNQWRQCQSKLQMIKIGVVKPRNAKNGRLDVNGNLLTKSYKNVTLQHSGSSTFLQRGSPPPPPWRLLPGFFLKPLDASRSFF